MLSETVYRNLAHLLPHVLHTHGWAPTRGHLADTRTAALRPAHAITRHKLTPICAHPQRSCAYAPIPHAESPGPFDQTLPVRWLRVAAAERGRPPLLETLSPAGYRGCFLPRYVKVKSQMFESFRCFPPDREEPPPHYRCENGRNFGAFGLLREGTLILKSSPHSPPP